MKARTRKVSRVIYGEGGWTPRKLATHLRDRCALNFGRVEKEKLAKKIGWNVQRYLDRDSGVTIDVTGVHSSKMSGASNFDVYAFDSKTDKTIWLAIIVVDKDLNVFVGETEGKVPRDLLACALED